MAIAKWYKVDFHTHSPKSNCFPDKAITAEQWVSAAKDSGVNAVVLTDHNSAAFLRDIERVKSSYEQNNIFKVFYGIELCVSAGFTHILIIFDDNLNIEQIEDAIIGDLNLPRVDWGNTEINVSEDKLESLCKKLKDQIFIIPAHFAANKGLAKSNINAIKKYQKFTRFSAIEVRNQEDVDEYKNKLLLKVINEAPMITGSDNPSNQNESHHSIEGFGKQFTWVKLSKLNFSGLRQVFIDPEYRCINAVDLISLGVNFNPNYVNHNYLSGLKLYDFKHLDDINIRFSPYLNCIVGGRGSGKSTIVEAIGVGLKCDQNIEKTKIIKSTMNVDGTISLYYDFGTNQKFTINAKKVNKKLLSFECCSNNVVIEEPPAFIADVYGQKEIFALIENDENVELLTESPLVKLIDKRLLVNVFSVTDEIDQQISRLLQLSQQYDNNKSKISELSSIKAEIKRINSSLTQYKQSGLELAREKYDKLNNIIQSSEILLDTSISTLHEIEQEMLIKSQDVDEMNCFSEKIFEQYPEIHEIVNITKKTYIALQKTIKNRRKTLENKRNTLSSLPILIDKEQAQIDYESAIGKVRETGRANIKDLQDKLVTLKKREAQLTQLKNEQEVLFENIKLTIDTFLKKRLNLSGYRKDVANNENITNIKIMIFPLEHKIRWKQNLQREFGKENAFESNFESLCSYVLNADNNYKNYKDYLLFILTSPDGNLNSFYKEEITESRFLKLWTDKQQKGTLSSLIKVVPEDLITIKIIDGGNEIDINDGSPGQKSAAVLAFILSSGDHPLIIDQPEDDLDNSLIYNLIVKSIRQMKKRRQIIIVTHNPNIPVLGDAEAIIILERDKNGKVKLRKDKKAGCLEEPLIREGICEIMEGGEEAFKKREEKYLYK